MPHLVTFWGTRGSIPTPGPSTARYGGNTPCIAIRGVQDQTERLVILDAGTGARALGQRLLEEQAGPIAADLLVTHTHWDHIQGLPHFAPLFDSASTVNIWGAKPGDVSLESVLREQMRPVVFPVPLDQLSAELSVTHVEQGDFSIEGFDVRAVKLRHPGATLGYVLTPSGRGASLAYITDNELTGGTYDVKPDWREELVEAIREADVLVHDAMYSPDELDAHAGWGHSSTREAVELAVEANVGQIVLFHHRPEHDDRVIDELLADARDTARRCGGGVEVLAAREGMQLTL